MILDDYNTHTLIDALSSAYQRLGNDADREYLNDKLKEVIEALEIKTEEK